jgi:hypothetical protein
MAPIEIMTLKLDEAETGEGVAVKDPCRGLARGPSAHTTLSTSALAS